MSAENTPMAVPLVERLRSVPIERKEMIEVEPCHHRNIPYGAMCHEAADFICAQQMEIDRLQKESESDTARMAELQNWKLLGRAGSFETSTNQHGKQPAPRRNWLR